MEKKKLDLIFLTEEGKKFGLAVDDPKENLLPTEVKSSMEDIISKNLFLPSSKSLREISEARITTTRVENLSLE